VLLAAGSPLFQHWFARTRDRGGRDPYALYVASNLGSFSALLAYPFVVEPWVSVGVQSRGWTAGYVLLVLLALACGFVARSSAPVMEPASDGSRVTWKDRLAWLILAPVPLLWVIPLALYLLTFVIAFGSPRPLMVAGLHKVLPYLVIAIAILIFLRSEIPGPGGYTIHVVTFFACVLACHLRLAASRPAPSHLTEFYVWLAVGGAVGGVFNVLIAPNVFNTVAEYPLVLIAAAALSMKGPRLNIRDLFVPGGTAVALIILMKIATRTAVAHDRLALALIALILGAGAIAAFSFRARPVRFALGIAAFLTAGAFRTTGSNHTEFSGRSFYGVYRVVDDAATQTRKFYSGTTVHGSEFLNDTALVPLTYYHRNGPLGSLFSARAWRPAPWRVAVVGLGTGATAAYARDGEAWTFYEIDPLVARVAEDQRFFHFLSSAKARPRIVLGDARLSLEREPPRSFDVLLVDAFSSDAIPMHLLTREALDLYRTKVTSDGIIAWHISNRYLDLRSVLLGLANDAGLVAVIRDEFGVPSTDAGRLPSTWVVMTQSTQTAASVGEDARWIRLTTSRRPTLWTDDFSNVLSVLR
jgi:spermidine synthase